MSGPITVWGTADIANALGLSRRQCEDMLRDPECPSIPYFGKLGNSRCYDPLAVQAALPKVRQWLDGASDRAVTKRKATLAEQEAALARRQAEIQAELAETAARYAFFRDSEARNKAEADALNERHKGQRAIIPGAR